MSKKTTTKISLGQLRKDALGMTQSQLAIELNVTARTVARWESGVVPKIAAMAICALAKTKGLEVVCEGIDA